MIYVMSDIHGCYDKYRNMLEKLSLTDDDAIFVLGDVIDYGADGVRILKDMMYRTNVYPILGEHEYMARRILPELMDAKNAQDCGRLISEGNISLLERWLKNGGQPTMEAYLALNEENRESVIDYLGEFEPYEEIRAGGRDFVLVHAGIRSFDPKKELSQYNDEDFVFGAADYTSVYFRNKYLVTGHTPTVAIDPHGGGRVYSKNRHLAIDCGAYYGGRLAAVCLDTLKVSYC